MFTDKLLVTSAASSSMSHLTNLAPVASPLASTKILFLKNTRRSLAAVVDSEKTYKLRKGAFNPVRNPTTPQKPLENPRFSSVAT